MVIVLWIPASYDTNYDGIHYHRLEKIDLDLKVQCHITVESR